MDGAFDAWEAKAGPTALEDLAAVVYHAPFGGITFRAHRMLLSRSQDLDREGAWAHFEAHSLPALTHHRRTSGAYSASIFWSLLGLCEMQPTLAEGDRIGIFSYGSGSCAEFFTARVGPHARERTRAAGVGALLDSRERLDVPRYEVLERARNAMVGQRHWRPDPALATLGLEARKAHGRVLVLEGIADHVRSYRWS